MLHRTIRLLVIEDSPAFRRLILEAFRNLAGTIPWELSFAEDGEKALALLDGVRSLLPDLILLDWNLPKVHGDVVLQRVKADARLRRTPVIVLSSSSAAEDVQMAYDHHANGYITKPLELDALYRTVAAIEQFWTSIVQLPTAARIGVA